jgi:predicted dehydrogenase
MSNAANDPGTPTIGWGILGAGNIANRFATSLAHDPRARLVAASGRTEAHLSTFAEAHHPDRTYLDHQALIEDDSVDAIYVALPHGLHATWSKRALERGKAVLCEKPACLSADEVADVIGCARRNGTLFMEAMKTRFVPAYAKVMELVDEGTLGRVTAVRASICRLFPDDIGGYFADPVQGGCLYDMGIYAASWLDALAPGPMELVQATVGRRGEVDWSDDALLMMGGVPCELECAADHEGPTTLLVQLEKGLIEVPQTHRPVGLDITDAAGTTRHVDAPYDVDDFFGEVRHFDDCLEQGLVESPVMPHSASLRMAELVDLIRKSEEKGTRVGPSDEGEA